MRPPRTLPLPAILLAAACCACRALPPPHAFRGASGIVRASSPEEAGEVASMLDALAPQVRALLPDSRSRALEVWVQDAPSLYRFPTTSMQDADGFWADSACEIHLRRGADDLRRTLAHELTHASLGRSWRGLPGTLEEGVCDVVSARLCPGGAPRLRAGRLSAAAIALGGLALDVEVVLPDGVGPLELRRSATVSLRISGDPADRIDPAQVFEVQAGYSTTRMSTDRKRGYYGLAFLVAERIVARAGFQGLHELAEQARAQGDASIRVEQLLAAAELDADPVSWREAAMQALGPAELEELASNHRAVLVRTLIDLLEPCGDADALAVASPWLEARLSIPGGASLPLFSIPDLRHDFVRALDPQAGSVLAVAGLAP
jgi:hypothetical protein